MSDSERLLVDSVVVGNQGTLLGSVDPPVPPDARSECQQPLGHPCHDSTWSAGAMLFEGELAFEGVDDALDPLADRAERALARRLILAVGAEQSRTQLRDSGCQEAVGEAFVADDDLAFRDCASVKESLSHLSLSQLGIGQAPVDHQAVGSREQVELEAPEVAGVAGTVAVVGVPSQGRALYRLSAAGAGKRGGVEQAQPVTPGGRLAGEVAERRVEDRSQSPQSLVVARLLGQVGEEIAQSDHAKRSQRCSEGLPSRTWATAKQTS